MPQLPNLDQLFFPAVKTIFRGKNVGENGIIITEKFENVRLEKDRLQSFRDELGFSNDVPLSFMYLMAQRAQAFLMLDKRFTRAIPGLIHIENELKDYGV